MRNFIHHTGHLYTVKNQNGFNNALYDYFNATGDGANFTKAEVRKMVQNFPPYYPVSMIIIDQSFECNRVFIEFFKMDVEAAILLSFCVKR